MGISGLNGITKTSFQGINYWEIDSRDADELLEIVLRDTDLLLDRDVEVFDFDAVADLDFEVLENEAFESADRDSEARA